MSIPFVDLKAQFARVETDVRAGIDSVLAHGKFIMGPEVGELETQLAEFAGVKHAITCSSGTDALLIPLMAYGVGPGDAILTSPFTFIATAEVISMLGATPVFVDVDPRTFNLDPQALELALRSLQGTDLRPRGVISVDIFGLPAEADEIMSIAERNSLFVLEDAAQSFGATYKGRAAGSLGHVASTSFFPAKPLGCYGDGGAMFTDDDDLCEIIKSIRIHGKGTDKYDNIRIGVNGRLDTMQAAILLAKLKIFPDELAARQRVADRYTDELHELVETPFMPNASTSAWAQYSVLSDQRDRLQASLGQVGVPTAVYYPTPLHLQTAFASLGYKPGNLPVSETLAERIISLPMHPYMEPETQDEIVAAVGTALEMEHT